MSWNCSKTSIEWSNWSSLGSHDNNLSNHDDDDGVSQSPVLLAVCSVVNTLLTDLVCSSSCQEARVTAWQDRRETGSDCTDSGKSWYHQWLCVRLGQVVLWSCNYKVTVVCFNINLTIFTCVFLISLLLFSLEMLSTFYTNILMSKTFSCWNFYKLCYSVDIKSQIFYFLSEADRKTICWETVLISSSVMSEVGYRGQ